MGLAPWESLPGDFLIQFWNTDTVLVAREKGDSKEMSLVGRAGMVKDGGAMSWHVPTQRDVFETRSEWIFDYFISISTLTRLTLDTIQWPGIDLQFHYDRSEHTKHTWTSHDFEMGDIEAFSDGTHYDYVWDTGQLPQIDETHIKDFERTCFSEPCQLYSSRNVEGLPRQRRLNIAGTAR
jgi:hypothetical protein